MCIRDLFFTKFFLNALYNHRFTKIYFSLFGSPVVKKPFSRTEQVMILYVFAIPAAFIIIRNLHFPNNFRSLPKRTLKTINNHIYTFSKYYLAKIDFCRRIFCLWQTTVPLLSDLCIENSIISVRAIVYFHFN